MSVLNNKNPPMICITSMFYSMRTIHTLIDWSGVDVNFQFLYQTAVFHFCRTLLKVKQTQTRQQIKQVAKNSKPFLLNVKASIKLSRHVSHI